MADVILRFQGVQQTPSGRSYTARACGREREDGSWEGWIEFEPLDGGPPVRTSRETTQPRRDELVYWATGLSNAYLDGALERAIRPPVAPVEVPVAGPLPAFDAPAPRRPGVVPPAGGAVLDPYAVYAEGEDVLRGQLDAMDAGHLRTIIRDYHLSGASLVALELMGHQDLVAMIVAAVRSGRPV